MRLGHPPVDCCGEAAAGTPGGGDLTLDKGADVLPIERFWEPRAPLLSCPGCSKRDHCRSPAIMTPTQDLVWKVQQYLLCITYVAEAHAATGIWYMGEGFEPAARRGVAPTGPTPMPFLP